MTCPNCTSEMVSSVELYHYRECGLPNIWMERCTVLSCQRCQIRMAVLPDPETAAREIALALALQEKRLDARSILFLRKFLRLKSMELAVLLRVNRVEVSRWENCQSAIDAINDFRLRLAAIDRIAEAAPHIDSDELMRKVCIVFKDKYEPSRGASDSPLTISAFARGTQCDDCPGEGEPPAEQVVAGNELFDTEAEELEEDPFS
jgi:DNA-binding transcriptional regulator YiaG